MNKARGWAMCLWCIREHIRWLIRSLTHLTPRLCTWCCHMYICISYTSIPWVGRADPPHREGWPTMPLTTMLLTTMPLTYLTNKILPHDIAIIDMFCMTRGALPGLRWARVPCAQSCTRSITRFSLCGKLKRHTLWWGLWQRRQQWSPCCGGESGLVVRTCDGCGGRHHSPCGTATSPPCVHTGCRKAIMPAGHVIIFMHSAVGRGAATPLAKVKQC